MPKRDLSSSNSSYKIKRKVKKMTTHDYITKRESSSKMKPKSMYKTLPLDGNVMKFYRVYKVKNYFIYNLIDLINTRRILIYYITVSSDKLTFNEYEDISYNSNNYRGQHTQYSYFLEGEELITEDIIGKDVNTNDELTLFNNIDLIDNLYTNINGTAFYYIPSITDFANVIKKDYGKSVKVKVSKKTIDIGVKPYETSISGGSNHSHIKYMNCVRKIRIDKYKLKYIIINKEIIFLKDIRGKYSYI